MAEKVVIIGSGPAGWSAAIYAARANLKPLAVRRHAAARHDSPGAAGLYHRSRELRRLSGGRRAGLHRERRRRRTATTTCRRCPRATSRTAGRITRSRASN